MNELTWTTEGRNTTARKGQIAFEITEYPDETELLFIVNIWYCEEFPEKLLGTKFKQTLTESQNFCIAWFNRFKEGL